MWLHIDSGNIPLNVRHYLALYKKIGWKTGE